MHQIGKSNILKECYSQCTLSRSFREWVNKLLASCYCDGNFGSEIFPVWEPKWQVQYTAWHLNNGQTGNQTLGQGNNHCDENSWTWLWWCQAQSANGPQWTSLNLEFNTDDREVIIFITVTMKQPKDQRTSLFKYFESLLPLFCTSKFLYEHVLHEYV